MNPDPRKCDEKCPNCNSDRFFKPWPAGDHFEWDCHDCNLEVPMSPYILAGDLMDAWRSKSWRPVLRELFPNIDFGEPQE